MKIYFLFFFFYCYALTLGAQGLFEKDGLLKIATTQEGVYKLDQQFFRDAGIDPLTVDPQKVQVYGMEGGVIPQRNKDSYSTSPQPLGMYLLSNDDSKLDENEAVLFYADHVDELYFDAVLEKYSYEKNYYADSLYYFVDINFSGNQKLITASNLQVANAQTELDYYDHMLIHEQELRNILSSGRKWFGESFFVDKTRTFEFELPHPIQNNQKMVVETQYLGQSFSKDTLRIYVGDFLLAYQDLPSISPIDYSNEGYIVNNKSDFNTSLISGEQRLSIKLSHLPSSQLRSEGKLDYLFLSVPQQLQFGASQIVLRNRKYQEGNPFSVNFGSDNPELIWDVSNHLSPSLVTLTDNGKFHYAPLIGQEVQFVAFNADQAFRPNFIRQRSSFSLESAVIPDLLIVSHAQFIQAAHLLAAHRTAIDGYSVKVVDQRDVFDQYGSGRRDVSALRNFIRAHFLAEPQKLKYVLFIGAASYDYKDRVANNTNYIPIYQSINSVSPTATYSSDDFYAFMDENEGEWIESSSDISDMELGIGRIPCRTAEEALNSVNKIIRYESDSDLQGKWRNELYFVADDEDVNADVNSFYRQSDQLADSLAKNYGGVHPNKLYVGSYEQEVFASYERSPAMQEALSKMMQKGALIVNYIGHGAYNSWTDEAILTNNLISTWRNTDHFPLFITATCEFGRHDSPALTSGAQVLLHQKNSGAIGLLTTSRPVFSNTNFELNKAFYQSAFERTTTGEGKKLGDIIRDTKNNSISGVKNRNFILLGDPSLSLGVPKKQILVESIESVSSGNDTIKSQDRVVVSGFVADHNGTMLAGFNGTLIAELFDKPTSRKTIVEGEEPYVYAATDNILFRGKASVVDGQFDISFYVPKEMNYQLGKGELKLYAYQKESMDDAGGYDNDIIIGGSISDAINDNNGPDISLFLNDSSFVNGERVGSKNDLLVYLADEFGISISNSSLNPGIYYQLDDEFQENLNDYFYYDTDSYQQGAVRLSLPEISEGKHIIKVYARDIANNLSQNKIEFFVINNASVAILDFKIYPNPAKESTNLQFTHSRRDEEMLVDLSVIDHQGRLVYSQQFETNEYLNKVSWDLRRTSGEKVSAGMYFINLMVRSIDDGSKTQQIKKLIIIN
jgi:hypothetical protein